MTEAQAGTALATISLEMEEQIEKYHGRLAVVHKLLQGTMVKGTHYDVIPGTQNNSLLKPGAELVARIFNLRVDIADVNEVYDSECGFYRAMVKTRLVNRAGENVGEGIGECNSFEGRFRYRYIGADRGAEDEARRRGLTLGDLPKRTKTTSSRSWTEYRFENDDLWSTWNSVLKQAKKRSLVDVILATTGCSEVFAQDARDFDHFVSTGEFQEIKRGAWSHPAKPRQGNSRPAAQAPNNGGGDHEWVLSLEGILESKGLTRGQARGLVCGAMHKGWSSANAMAWMNDNGYGPEEAAAAILLVNTEPGDEPEPDEGEGNE